MEVKEISKKEIRELKKNVNKIVYLLGQDTDLKIEVEDNLYCGWIGIILKPVMHIKCDTEKYTLEMYDDDYEYVCNSWDYTSIDSLIEKIKSIIGPGGWEYDYEKKCKYARKEHDKIKVYFKICHAISRQEDQLELLNKIFNGVEADTNKKRIHFDRHQHKTKDGLKIFLGLQKECQSILEKNINFGTSINKESTSTQPTNTME